MKKVLSALTVLFVVYGQQLSAQQPIPPAQHSDIEHVGASLESVQTLKALAIDQIDYYEVSVWGPGSLDSDSEKRSANGLYRPRTALGANLKELSELVASRPLQVAVSNPNDVLYAQVRYYSALDEKGNRPQMFYGQQPFKLLATQNGYVFPKVRATMRMTDLPSIWFPGVQLSSVKVTERSPNGQIIDEPQYLEINWQSGGSSVVIPAYLLEGERQGEIVFHYWEDDNELKAKIFDLGTGLPKEASIGGGTVSSDIEGVITVYNDDVVIDLPEGGRVPLIQLIIPATRDMRFRIRGVVNRVPESAESLGVRLSGQGFEWGTESLPSEGQVFTGVDAGVYWLLPVFNKYGKDLPPEYLKPQPQPPSVGGGFSPTDGSPLP